MQHPSLDRWYLTLAQALFLHVGAPGTHPATGKQDTRTELLDVPAQRPTTKVLAFRGPEVVEASLESLEDFRARPGEALWVDILGPTPEALAHLAEAFGLHPLAVEDALKRSQRPKAEEYDRHLFISTHAARLRGAGGHDVALDEIDIFFGEGFLITSHGGAAHAVDDARRRVMNSSPQLRSSPGYALYAVLDAVVDSYFPVLDALDDYTERLEDSLFRHPAPRTLDRLFASRRALLHLRRVAAPQRDMINLLARHQTRLIDQALGAYFRDIYDHLLRITDQIDTHRDLLAGALDIYVGMASNRLSEVMKVLTMITAVFASLAVITGIYGMNFERALPPFAWRYGFAAVLGTMAASVAVMVVLFRRQRWL